MINDTPQQYDVQSNVTGDTVAMGIDPAAMAHIMGVLTDLYSDPKLAILREYSTNALDSHIEAGITRPIEVTTPSSLSPFFTVKDFGIGMSHDDIRSIYSQYGASTKRNTNSQVGMLGLGCKSALSYASQFTLVGVKDGIRITVVIGRDEDGAGSMTVADTATTDEPNGVTVMVPARIADAPEFQRKAAEFFRFWAPGTVLVDGQQPDAVEGLKITDDLTVIEGGQSYVVMGNVAYPARIDHGLTWRAKVVARVPIGSVNFTPSREALHYTPKTEGTLRKVAVEFKAAKVAAVQRIVAESATHNEALTTAMQWAHKLGVQRSSLTYKGESLPESFKPTPGQVTLTSRTGKLSGHSTSSIMLNAESYGRTMIVQNYDAASFTAGQKKKLLMKANEIRPEGGQVSFQTFLLLAGTIPAADRKWFPADAVTEWAPIKALKLPKAARTQNQWRLAGSFDLRRNGSSEHEVEAQEIGKVADEDLFYMHGNVGDGRKFDAYLAESYPNYVLVCLPGNRLDKFKRTFPEATQVQGAIQVDYKAWLAKVPASTKNAWTTKRHASNTSQIENLDLDRIPDPEFKAYLKVIKRDMPDFERDVARWHKLSMPVVRDCETEPLPCPLDRYPLFDYPSGYYHRDRDPVAKARQIEHLYLYISAVYAADQAAAAAAAE